MAQSTPNIEIGGILRRQFLYWVLCPNTLGYSTKNQLNKKERIALFFI
jgi:hypothetical protein